MLFVDTNVFIYAVGKDHPYKIPSLKFFEAVAHHEHEIAISVEILQEILFRFWSIRKVEEGFRLFDYASELSDWILPVGAGEVKRAKGLMEDIAGLTPRDAIHVAVMLNNRIATIVSYDRHFDQIEQIKRLEPESLF